MTRNVQGWAGDTQILAPVVTEADPGSFEHRAMVAFRIIAGFYLFGVVLAFFHEPNTLSALLIAGFNGAALLLAIIYLLVGRSLRVLRPWAVAVARPLLAFIVIEDVVQLLAGMVDGHIRGLPVSAGVAMWALFGARGLGSIPRPKALTVVVLVVVAPLLAMLVVARPLFDWGGALDVRADDIATGLVASCGPAGGNLGTSVGEPPEKIHITYDWTWHRTTPMPSGLDIVVIGWTGNDAQGRPLYLLGQGQPTERGIYDGRRRFPSLEMADSVAVQSTGSWQWGIELAERGFAPGGIELELDRAHDAAAGSEPLHIVASYVHVGQWHVDVPVTCEW